MASGKWDQTVCFPQTWYNNMGKAGDASIKPFDGEEFTCITFRPDLAKFKMSILDKDTVALMTRRAYDIAGSSKGVRVFFNGKRLPVSHHAVSLLCISISASAFRYFLPVPCRPTFFFYFQNELYLFFQISPLWFTANFLQTRSCLRNLAITIKFLWTSFWTSKSFQISAFT